MLIFCVILYFVPVTCRVVTVITFEGFSLIVYFSHMLIEMPSVTTDEFAMLTIETLSVVHCKVFALCMSLRQMISEGNLALGLEFTATTF